jgi:hypothetical protein
MAAGARWRGDVDQAQLRLLFTGMDWTRIGSRTAAMASK